MNTSVMQQSSGPLSSMPTFSGSTSVAFPSVAESQHSSNTSFIPNAQTHHLPNGIQIQHTIPQHYQQQQPTQQNQQQNHQPPPQHHLQTQSRPDMPSIKDSPTQQQQNLQRFANQQAPPQSHVQHMMAKPDNSIQKVSSAHMLPQVARGNHPNMNLVPQQNLMAHRYHQMNSQAQAHAQAQVQIGQNRSQKNDVIPSMPLPMHPDPVQTMQPNQEQGDGDRGFTFARNGFFEELPHDEGGASNAIAPPNNTVQENDQGNTLTTVDNITGPLGLPGVPNISNLPLPGISGHQASNIPNVTGFANPTNLGTTAMVTGPTDIAEALGVERKIPPYQQRRMRPVPRVRSQQMTELQRKKRHNEHTRASRSRIDRGLERLKNVIRKVRPNQKVTKKADVLQEAVKLLKEGYRLPATESDEEQEGRQESSLSV